MNARTLSVADVVTHPVRSRIVLQLGGRQLTTAQLQTAIPGVPRPTLYRHVAALIEARFVDVVAERRIRGGIERTLELGERMAGADEAGRDAMSQTQLKTAFSTFLGGVGGAFDRFLASDEAGLRAYLGFSRAPLYLTQDDLQTIQEGMRELLTPYLDEGGRGGRRVDFATVLIPEPRAEGEPPAG